MEKDIKIRIIQSKCMADMLVWLGFEYIKTEEGYLFQRSQRFDLVWRDIHILREKYRK
jgi:hypothetical protein